MTDKLYGVFGLIAGFLIAFIIFGKEPDINTTTDQTLRKKITDMVNAKKINSKTNVKGAKQIDIKPDGSMSFFGNNLDFYNNHEETNQLHLRINDLEKELTTKKTINYTGSVFVLFDNFTFIPCAVGITYLVIPPIQAIVQYDIPEKKIKAGVILQF